MFGQTQTATVAPLGHESFGRSTRGVAEPVRVHCLASCFRHPSASCTGRRCRRRDLRIKYTTITVIPMWRTTSVLWLNDQPVELDGVSPMTAAARLAARASRTPRHEGGLRRGRLRRLHRCPGARRRPSRGDFFLHRLAGTDRRPGRADRGRTAWARRRAARGAGGDGRVGRHAMRLLHPGLRDVGLRLRGGRRKGRPRHHPRCAGRQSLPLHRLSADRRRHGQGRGRARRARAATADPRRVGKLRRQLPRPRSLAELLALRAKYPEALLLAGATDLGLLASRSRRPPAAVIHVAEVPELASSARPTRR